jgi:hypothetical protein
MIREHLSGYDTSYLAFLAQNPQMEVSNKQLIIDKLETERAKKIAYCIIIKDVEDKEFGQMVKGILDWASALPKSGWRNKV